MIDQEEALLEIYLHPGESQLVQQPALIRTILGSCVGITFRHSTLGIAGMCHPMLPTLPPGRGYEQDHDAGCRFVDFAIQDMARKLDALGAMRREVEIKLFGGGDVLPASQASPRPTVGRLNCEMAIQTLAREGFAVAASSLGGTCGVNILFDSRSGEIRLRRLGEHNYQTTRCPVTLPVTKHRTPSREHEAQKR